VSLKRDAEFTEVLLKFIYEINQVNTYNEIRFNVAKGNYSNANIGIEFNQTVEDNFQNKIPKSKRGKTLPWWKNPDEVKELI
jgi:hypothetical protein